MKYVLLFVETEQFEQNLEAMSQADRDLPPAALAEVDAPAAALERYHLYHATRADLLWTLGHGDEGRAANRRALEFTANPAEQAVLRRRIDWGDDAG
jgi:predicted RNA polymerase sigma factor